MWPEEQEAERTNEALLTAVGQTQQPLNYAPLLAALTNQLASHHVRRRAIPPRQLAWRHPWLFLLLLLLVLMSIFIAPTHRCLCCVLQVPTRLASLGWVSMLLGKAPRAMAAFLHDHLLPALIKASTQALTTTLPRSASWLAGRQGGASPCMHASCLSQPGRAAAAS